MSKGIQILHGSLQTPPLSQKARIETGYLLRQLQEGETLSLPHSRPIPTVGNHCHELRVPDADANWRVMYFVDALNIVVLDVFSKKTEQTPKPVIDACRTRLTVYLTEKLAEAKTAQPSTTFVKRKKT